MGNVNSNPNDNHHRPKVIWKWEVFSGTFLPYPPHASEQIEKHFLTGSRDIFIHKAANYHTYEIDFINMTQKNRITHRQRKIRREILRDSFSTIRWSWENTPNEMQPYTLDISDKIEAFYKKGGDKDIDVKIGGFWYKINPTRKTQVNMKTNKARRIERYTLQDHKYIWQWEQDDSTFCDFYEPDSLKIELEFLARKGNEIKISLGGRVNVIDTEKMEIRDPTTERVRQVRRVQENYLQYTWFWRQKEKSWRKWIPFSSELSDKLELNYLSSKQCMMLIEIEGVQYEIDTISHIKKRKSDGADWKIKREPLSNDRPVWTWKTKSGTLRTFPQHITRNLETKYILNQQEALVSLKEGEIIGRKYTIDIKKMEMMNEKSGNIKQIERHVIPNFYPSTLESLSQRDRLKVLKFLRDSGHLPLEWEWNQLISPCLFEVSDRERNLLSGEFYSSLKENEYTIEKIERIQNIPQINDFLLEKMNIRYFSHGNNDPTLLFYVSNGENPEEFFINPEPALKEKMSPRDDYGKGIYFTRSAKLCDGSSFRNDTQAQILIAFWAITGEIANINDEQEVEKVYNGKYKSKKEIQKAPENKDSISAVIDGEEVIIVYRPERCYPLYSIHYRKNNIE